MHNQLFQLQQQLLQQKGGLDGYPSSGSGISVAGSTSNYPDGATESEYVAPNTPSRALTIKLAPEISYRPILPSDLEVLKDIHEALFPIKYESEFFTNVVHGLGIISWAAVDRNRSDANREELVGFVTARTMTATEAEEADMLGYEYGNTGRTLIYILTLGVIRQYRNYGIASTLVSEVTEYAKTITSCRAVYLHVISYNKTAILFYEKNSFYSLRKLRNFYYINGHYYDAYLYVFYVNGIPMWVAYVFSWEAMQRWSLTP
eukprot:TRINITY_DN981_c0_g1_i2.p1 TRINITY_DN981_c0_g1~~TRINITY_DN981_c0_g1_i2.p1  ORF type:complete len:261 (+),score=30.99 TRINITY_DN981_c0_g1_i2:308-1090(+)